MDVRVSQVFFSHFDLVNRIKSEITVGVIKVYFCC